MAFALPSIPVNPDGWGPPVKGGDPEDAPLGAVRVDRNFGRVADWTNTGQNRYNYNNRFQPHGTSPFNVGVMREEDDYTTVDYSKSQALRKSTFRPFNFRGNRGRGQPMWRGRTVARGRVEQRQSKWKQNLRNDQYRGRRAFVHRMASVEVRPTWKVVAQFALADLSKRETAPPPNPQDLKTCGFLDVYNADVAPSVRAPVALQHTGKTFHSVTTTEDPVIRDLSMEDAPSGGAAGADGPPVRVFCTDGILAAIMASPRSAASWDVQVEVMDLPARDGAPASKVVFLDKRDDFDLLPVGDGRAGGGAGDAARAVELAEELALVNQRFSQTVLKKGQRPWRPAGAVQANPFAEQGDDVASALYRYRRWQLGRRVQLYVRTQLDGVVKAGGKAGAGERDQTYRAFALNEHDPKATDWRRKLETAAGAVLATEIKNNGSILAKWAAQALLAGADQLKLGYVARTNPQNRLDHQLLQIQHYAPQDFARQISMNIRNVWAIAQAVVDECAKLAEGKYVLLKDPNKQMLHLYAVPDDEAGDSDADADTGAPVDGDEAIPQAP